MNASSICRGHLRHGASCLRQLERLSLLTVKRLACPGVRIYSSSATAIAGVTEKDIEGARTYCSNFLRTYDTPSYTLLAFIPPPARDAYLALRSLNIDVARIADSTSTPQLSALRMQFWRDAIARSLTLTPPKEPIATLLSAACLQLSALTNNSARLSKSWLYRVVNAREAQLGNPPWKDMAALESYAENTYSTLLYLTLAAVPLTSMTADHIASHIGKAQGIATILRGLPLVAFPRPPSSHSPQNALGGALSSAGRQGSISLPLDVMAEFGVREETVFRQAGKANGLKEAVFNVATRANDHLITAREMLKNVNAGRDVGHEYEHQDDVEHGGAINGGSGGGVQKEEVNRGFGVFMPAISTQMWLDRLQKADFDVFEPTLRGGEWKLPWKAYWAFRRGKF